MESNQQDLAILIDPRKVNELQQQAESSLTSGASLFFMTKPVHEAMEVTTTNNNAEPCIFHFIV